MTFRTDTARIRRWREERRWSQEHLAELAGVSLRTLQRVETGQEASDETLKALANAFQVDVMALSLDPHEEARRIVAERSAKGVAGVRLSLAIHAAGWVIGMAVFTAINLVEGAFVMKQPMLWWTVGLIAHAATLAIVEVVGRFQTTR